MLFTRLNKRFFNEKKGIFLITLNITFIIIKTFLSNLKKGFFKH